MKQYLLIAVAFLGILLLVGSLFLLPPKPDLRPKNAVLSENNVNVSVSIGNMVSYELFGYTSSLALVKLEGIGLSIESRADSKGYFSFSNFLAPAGIQEFCLTSIDTEGGVSPALCVPTPLDNNTTHNMGPYLLPPSIRISSATSDTDEPVSIMGKTIPNTDVALTLYPSTTQSTLSLINSVYAAENTQHTIQTKAQNDGSYSYRYTGNAAGKVRVFSRSKYSGQFTPKSNTLSFSILSMLMVFLLQLIALLKKILTPNTILTMEIAAISAFVGIIIYNRLHRRVVKPVYTPPPVAKHPIIPYKEPELMVLDYTKIKEL